MKTSVAALAQLPGVWRGGELEHVVHATVPTGHRALDRELPGGGWPVGTLSEVLHDGVGIGAVMKTPPNVPHSIWNHYIGVADIDKAAEAIGAGGGQVVNGPMEIPGGEYSLNGTDPQGAMFGVLTSSAYDD